MQELLGELSKRIPFLGKVIKIIKFQFCNTEGKVAFLIDDTIYFKDALFTKFNKEEQLFIIAHEIMHYIIHHPNGQFIYPKDKDPDLVNFVEDAQINQLLIKYNLIPPRGAVLLKDALDYTEDELYNLLLPKLLDIKGWCKNITEWDEFSSTEDILIKR